MASEDFEDRLRRHEQMLEGLGKLWLRQGEINEELRASVAELKAFNRQQLEFNADLKTTLARVETLLARLPRGEENGRDA